FKAGSATPSLASVTARATPNAAGTSTSTGAVVGTSYSISGVQVGTGGGAGAGHVDLLNLPAGCTLDASGASAGNSASAGLPRGGSVGASPNYVLDCGAPPPSAYQLTASWSPVTGGHSTLTVAIDMTTLNLATNNGAGADQIWAFEIDNITYNT